MSENIRSEPFDPNPTSSVGLQQSSLDSSVGKIPGWLKQFFVCNPFYLASAALLLYGVYRVSVDPNFFSTEVNQLTFNFTSLQIYEVLLVATAIFLARRHIRYDSSLLVVLENLFTLVPFILVSQAALIKQSTVWLLCLLAAFLAFSRTSVLRQQLGEMMPAWRALACGAVLLAANATLPILYRHFHETKVGTKLAEGTAYEFNEFAWFWLLPVLCTLALLLPRPQDPKNSAERPRWFTLTMFLFWIFGTGVHLYCLSYVYDFDLRREQLAPALWILAWTLNLRFTDFTPTPSAALRKTMLLLPAAITLVPISIGGEKVVFLLSVLNVLGFGWLCWTQRGNRLALHLALLSLAAAYAAMPVEFIPPDAAYLNRSKLIGAAMCSYLMISCLLTRNPKVAIFGAIGAAAVGGVLRGGNDDAWHWAAQAGLVYFLLHSLRWRDYEHPGTREVRAFISCLWVIHTIIWVRNGAEFWQPLSTAGIVVLLYWWRGFVFQVWSPHVIPVAAGLVAICSPLNFTYLKLQTTPAGVLAILGSLLLFALGTVAALTKHRWYKSS